MPRRLWLPLLGLGVLAASAIPAHGQPFTKLITNYEGTWTFLVDTPQCEVIFRDPANASTTSKFVNIAAGNDTFVASTGGLGDFVVPVSGTQADLLNWVWTNASHHRAWIRMQSTNAPDLPNPSLHLAGKVRFYFGGTAYTDNTFGTQVTNAQVYLGICVREVGEGIPMGRDGGSAGNTEWVGLNSRLVEITAGTNGFCDTAVAVGSDDVQVRAPGTPAGEDDVCIDGGTNGVLNSTLTSDDATAVTPIGMFTVPLDRVMRLYEFDLPALEAAGKVFSFIGDAHLEATPNNRGTLEHLAITNDPANGGKNANLMLLWIDDVTFEAPIPDPPVILMLPAPPQPLDTSVALTGVTPSASLVEVLIKGKGGDADYLLGSVANPGSADVTIPTSIPLPFNVDIFARQTVSSVPSDDSTLFRVNAPGNGPIRLSMGVRETDQYDHALSCGDDGTGFDSNQPSNIEFIGATGMVEGAYGTPVGGRRLSPVFGWNEIIFDPCVDPIAAFSGNGHLNITSTGVVHTNDVWEGLYWRIDATAPTTGPYTIYIDDMRVLAGGSENCLIDDFESYTVASHIVENAAGTAATTASGDDVQVVAVGGPTFTGQIIVSPGPNGTLDTTPAGGEAISPLHARFNDPGVAGTQVGVASSPSVSTVTVEEAFSGAQSLKVQWAFISAANQNSHLRLTSNGSTATNPPETFVAPDPVVPVSLDGTFCDGVGDLAYSFMLKMEPSPVMGDCDMDLDIDMIDFACFQRCFGASPLSPECDATFDYYADDNVDVSDYQLFQLSFSGAL